MPGATGVGDGETQEACAVGCEDFSSVHRYNAERGSPARSQQDNIAALRTKDRDLRHAVGSGKVDCNRFHRWRPAKRSNSFERFCAVGIAAQRGRNIDAGHCADRPGHEQTAILRTVAEANTLGAE